MPKKKSGARDAESAVFSRIDERHLEEACTVATTAGALRIFRSRRRWTTAAKVVSRQGPIPIYFAVTDGTPTVRYEAELVEVHIDPNLNDEGMRALLRHRGATVAGEEWDDTVETVYLIRGCRKLSAPFPQDELVKVDGGMPVELNYTRAYALVCRRSAVEPVPTEHLAREDA